MNRIGKNFTWVVALKFFFSLHELNKVIGLRTLGFFYLIIKNYWLLVSKKLKCYDTGRVFPRFDINIEGVKLLSKTVFNYLYYLYIRYKQYMWV